MRCPGSYVVTKGECAMELTKTDLELVVTRLPKDVRELMVTHTGLMVGGGFIRSTIAGERVSDIDLFGPAKSLLRLAALSLSTSRSGKLHSSDNAYTVLTQSRMPVQFITRWLFGSCEDLVKSFDFTVCQAAVAYVDCAWKSCCCDAFYTDLAARRLVYTAPDRNEDAGGSMLRMRKFLSRGYNIQAPSMAGVIARLIGGINFDKVRTEKDREVMIVSLLREVDPLIVVDGLDMVDEHEVMKGVVLGG